MYDKENMGIILVRTATLLLVATYTPEMSPSICVEAVEKLGELHNNLLQLITQGINITAQLCLLWFLIGSLI